MPSRKGVVNFLIQFIFTLIGQLTSSLHYIREDFVNNLPRHQEKNNCSIEKKKVIHTQQIRYQAAEIQRDF